MQLAAKLLIVIIEVSYVQLLLSLLDALDLDHLKWAIATAQACMQLVPAASAQLVCLARCKSCCLDTAILLVLAATPAHPCSGCADGLVLTPRTTRSMCVHTGLLDLSGPRVAVGQLCTNGPL